MRESMLHDLYFGNFSPWEHDRIRTREYRTVIWEQYDGWGQDLS